jgi:hypothetical protein
MAEVRAAGQSAPWVGFGIAIVLGIVWAWLTYAAAASVSRLLGRDTPAGFDVQGQRRPRSR